MAAPMPPAPPVTMAIRPARLFGFGIRCSFASSKQPVLDVEGLLLRQPAVFRHARGAAHHVDGVEVELARDPRRRLVLGEGDHPHPRHEIDDRVRVAQGRAVGMPAALVVGGIILPVGVHRRRKPGQRRVEVGLAGVEVHHQRPDLGAQEMVGAARPERRQRRHVAGVDELQHRRAVVEVPDHVRVLRDHPADPRHQRRRHPPPLLGRRAPHGARPPKAALPAVFVSSQAIARLMISSVVS